MEDSKLDNYLKSSMRNFEANPDKASFNAVLEKLNAKKKKRRAIIFLLSGGMAAILLITFLSFYFFAGSPTPVSQIVTVQAKHTVVDKGVKHSENTKQKAETVLQPKVNNKKASQNWVKPVHPNTLPVSTTKPDKVDIAVIVPTVEHKENVKDAVKITDFVNEKGAVSNDKGTNSTNVAVFVPDENAKVVDYNFEFLEPKALQNTKNEENLLLSKNLTSDSKNVLRIKSKLMRPVFFVGINATALAYTYKFSVNSLPILHSTGYTSNFADYYLSNRLTENRTYVQVMPSVKAGAIFKNVLELSVQLGYNTLRSNETIRIPEIDTTKNPGIPPTIMGAPGNSIAVTSYPTTSSELDGVKVSNKMKYLYTALNVSAIVRVATFKLKPGFTLGINKLISADYTFLDENGYVVAQNSTKFLSADVYTVAFKLGVGRRITNKIDIQLSPLFQFSANSLFDEHYFIKQKQRGFGLESSLIYRF